MTEHLQRNPTYQKGKGRPLPAQGAPLTDLTTVNLSRKRCPKTSGRTCVESMLCKVHPELYIPPLTQPTNNAPDLCHFTRLGVLCWFEVEQSWMIVCALIWSGGLVWRWSNMWELVHGLIFGRIWDSSDCLLWWSDLGRILRPAVVVWFHGLIWRTDWGRWSALTTENQKHELKFSHGLDPSQISLSLFFAIWKEKDCTCLCRVNQGSSK